MTTPLFHFVVASILFLFCSMSAVAQSSPARLKETARFIRVMNLVESRLTSIGKAGFDLVVDNAVISTDIRCRETSGFMSSDTKDLQKKWLLKSKYYPAADQKLTFSDPELLKSTFITILIVGTMSDGAQSVRALMLPDAVSSSSQALVRYISAVQSYPVSLEINGSKRQFSAYTVNPITCHEGKTVATLIWKDGKQRDRKLDYNLNLENGKAYTLIVADTGGGKGNLVVSVFDDSAMAKEAVEVLAESESNPSPSP